MTDDQIIESILEREAGYVNHPADRGGPTNLGITLRTLAASRGVPVTAADIRALTRTEAGAIYRERYLRQPGFEAIADTHLRHLLVDCAAHHGPERAVRWLQTALGGLVVDGDLGPKTRAALLQRGIASQLYRNVCAQRTRFFGRIVTNEPRQSVFAAGWCDRVADFVEVAP